MQDLRDVYRSLRGTPVLSVAAVLSLGLGIGANTAIFTIVDTLLVRALPVREPERLVLVTSGEGGWSSWSHPVWEEIRERAFLDGAFAWAPTRFDLAQHGEAELVDGIWVSGGFFDVLGVTALLGRTLGQADDRTRGGSEGAVAVISYEFWDKRFGRRADALGESITVERRPFTIVGVTPPGFFGVEIDHRFDIAIPLGTAPLIVGYEGRLENRFARWLSIMGRLKAGETLDTATAALRQAQTQIREATSPNYKLARDREAYLREPFTALPAARGTSFLRRLYERPLVAIMVVVSLVLLIACVNIANLLLARGAERRREFGIRLALGAARWRLARQLLAESLALSGLGAAFGLLVGYWSSRLLVWQLSTQSYMGNPFAPGPTVFVDLSLNWRVLLFTAATGLAATFLFGTAPALRAARVDPGESLKGQARGFIAHGRVGAGGMSVVAQVALSLVLLVAAGLFIRTFYALATLHLGFRPERVLVVGVDARRSALDLSGRPALYDRVREAAAAVPGVASAASSLAVPIGGLAGTAVIEVPGGPPLSEQERTVHSNLLTPGWFQTLGTRLVAGRDFDTRDRAGAPRVAIVNEAFAHRFMNGANPLGRAVREGFPGREPRSLEIIGLVEDAVYRSIRTSAPPTVYLPVAQAAPDDLPPVFSVVVQPSSDSPSGVARSVAAAISEVDRDLRLRLRPMANQVNATFNQERLAAGLAGVFGGLALLLVAVGLYGVTAHAVARRQAEIGIRIALGANPVGVVRIVLGRVAGLVSLGVVIGGIVSLWGADFVQTLLFGLPAKDAKTFGTAAVLLVAVAAVASWLPARRAARLDPASVLKEG